jgi:hypothetical protein
MTFKRFEGSEPNEDNGIRMDCDVLNAKSMTLTIGELLGRLESFTEEERSRYPWASRFVMGFPLPSWQRPLVWTQSQKSAFIESIWAGVDLGSYMVNDCYEIDKEQPGMKFREFSEVLLDGQQRLNSIEEYVKNEFSVVDAIGHERFWRDLPRIERRRFCGFHFSRACVKSFDERLLRKAYDLRAYGGTAHTADQMASSDVYFSRQRQ